MATSRCMNSCWRTCKRLKLTSSAPISIRVAFESSRTRNFSSASRRHLAKPSDGGPQSLGKGDSSTSPQSAKVPESKQTPSRVSNIKRQQFNLTPSRPQDEIRDELVKLARSRNIEIPDELNTGVSATESGTRLPRSVHAYYLRPLRRKPTHGIPVANLQLRSYSVRNLEVVADLAVRAAYYLNLPAKGPVPLPRITERWTVPKSNFIFKKVQQNFERVTVRRLVQVQDGQPEVVQRWLAFVRKCAWYGVGMKADVFEFEDTDVVKRLDAMGDEAAASGVEGIQWEYFGTRRGLEDQDNIGQLLEEQGIDVQSKGEAKAVR